MPPKPKLSGAELAARLGGLSSPATLPSFSPPSPAEAPAAPAGPPTVPVTRRTGRRPKAPDGLPVNLRLTGEAYQRLAQFIPELMAPGRPMPTVQDLIRALIDGALQEPERLRELLGKGASSWRA